jgi:hypothetical protein
MAPARRLNFRYALTRAALLRQAQEEAAMTIEPMTTLQAVLLILAGTVNLGGIVIFLRITWQDTRNAFAMRRQMTNLLEAVELRLTRLDRALHRIEDGGTIRKDRE